MKHHRNFTISVDFDGTIVNEAFPGIGILKKDADKYINLESETERLKEYIKSIEVRKYQIPFENDTIKIVGDVEVQGELKSLKYNSVCQYPLKYVLFGIL